LGSRETRMSDSMAGKALALRTRARNRPGLISSVMLAIGFLVVVYIAIGSLTWPLGNDQAHYSYMGDTVMAGGVLYRDAFDLKGPLTYYLYGWIRAALGHNDESIRILDLLAVSLFSWRLRHLVMRLNGYRPLGANIATLLFLFQYYAGGYGQLQNKDVMHWRHCSVGGSVETDIHNICSTHGAEQGTQ
jgi:hypothetical protein